jgi:hypothetical protein
MQPGPDAVLDATTGSSRLNVVVVSRPPGKPGCFTDLWLES